MCLDKWFEEQVKPRVRGECRLVRFADDFVLTFEDRPSGKRVLDVLGKRLGRHRLTLHETKTRYVDFRRKRPYVRASLDGVGHDLRLSRLYPCMGPVETRQGRGSPDHGEDRFARAQSVQVWCKQHRHLPILQQREHLARLIRGHCAY